MSRGWVREREQEQAACRWGDHMREEWEENNVAGQTNCRHCRRKTSWVAFVYNAIEKFQNLQYVNAANNPSQFAQATEWHSRVFAIVQHTTYTRQYTYAHKTYIHYSIPSFHPKSYITKPPYNTRVALVAHCSLDSFSAINKNGYIAFCTSAPMFPMHFVRHGFWCKI